MSKSLPGLLFANVADMNAAISERVEKDSREEIDPQYLKYKRVHYSLVPVGADGERLPRPGSEPVFLDKRPTLADIREVIADHPEVVEVGLNIDIRGFSTFQELIDNDDPGMCDTGIDLWKKPAPEPAR